MNEKLEQLIADYAKGLEREQLVKVMEELEKSQLMIPAMPPKNLPEEYIEKMKKGETFPMTPEMNPIPILITKGSKDNNEHMLPIFTSQANIKEDVQFPTFLQMPFAAVVTYAMKYLERIAGVVINPFTDGLILSKEMIVFADKRFKQMAQAMQKIQITETQLHKLAHMRVAYELLPKLFYTDPEAASVQLKEQQEQLVIDMYGTIYPEERPCPYTEEDLSIMSLSLREDLMITRIDMPAKNVSPNVALRVYIALKDEDKLYYYVIEKGEKGQPDHIGYITSNGQHTIVKDAPDNGAEFEAIMELVDEAE